MRVEAYRRLDPRPEPEKVVSVDVVTHEGNIFLAAMSPNGSVGHCGLLAEITSKGLRLIHNVDPALGFPLDAEGRLNVL